MATFKVLSLDGGGCRGVVTAILIERLHHQVPGFVQAVDLFAGTSIGAANAVALASDHDPATMSDFYRRHGEELFSKHYRPRGFGGTVLAGLEAVPMLGGLVARTAGLFLPKWDPAGLEEALREYFGESTRLGELHGRVVLLTMALAGEVKPWPARVVVPTAMNNFSGSPHLQLRCRDALLRSMSAPVFFPSTDDGFVDGGVFANNPSIAALATAKREGGQAISDVRMLSIGTGIFGDAIPAPRPLAWGLLGWGRHFSDVSLRAEGEFDHQQMQALMGDHYRRLDAVLPAGSFPMDDYRSIPALIDAAKRAEDTQDFEDAVRFLRDHFVPTGDGP